MIKMIKKFNIYNESVRDKMTPKSEDDIKNSLSEWPANDKLFVGVEKNLPYLVKQALEEGADLHLNNNNELFLFAVQNDQLEIVKLMIEYGADIKRGLRQAAIYGKYIITKYLLEHGGDATDGNLLINASYRGYINIVALLLEHGADIHFEDDKALEMAVVGNHSPVVELLVARGANPHARNDDIINRAKYMHQFHISWILDNPDKTNESVRDKMTPKSKDDIIDIIISRYPKPKGDKKYLVISKEWRDGRLYWTKISNSLLTREEALKVKKECELIGIDINQVVEILSYDDFIEMVKKNIITNIKLDESIRDKMTPKSEDDILKYFIGESIPNTITLNNKEYLIIDVGLIIYSGGVVDNVYDISDDGSLKELMSFIPNSKIPSLKELAKIHREGLLPIIDCNTIPLDDIRVRKYTKSNLPESTMRRIMKIPTSEYWSSDISAYNFQKLYYVKDSRGEISSAQKSSCHCHGILLVEKNKMNESVRDKMTPKSEEDILNRVKDYDPDKLFDLSFNLKSSFLLKYALDKGAEPELEYDNGVPYFIMTCFMGLYDFVKVLIEHGIDINMQVRRKRTPLIEAVLERHKDIVKLLLDSGADVNIKDDIGATALFYSDNADITKMLLEHGADKNIEDKYNQTALYYAEELGYSKDVIELLSIKTNESVRDKMTPVDIQPLIKKIKKMSFLSKIEFMYENNCADLFDFNELVDEFNRQKKGTKQDVIFYGISKDIIRLSTYGVYQGNNEDHECNFRLMLSSMFKTNEGVRDMMTPKSEEDIENSLKDITFYRAGRIYNSMSKGKVAENVIKYLPLICKCHQEIEFNPKVTTTNYLKDRWKTNDWKKLSDPEEFLEYSFEVVIKKSKMRFHISQHKTNNYLFCSFINPTTNKLDITKIISVKEFLDMINIGLLNESVKDMMTPKSEEEIKKALSNTNKKYKYNLLGQRLRKACVNHLLDEAEELLKLGADPNYNYDETAFPSVWDSLSYAISEQDVECIKLLFKYGAKVKSYHLRQAERNDWYRRDEIIKLLNQHTFKGKFKQFIGMNESVRDFMTPKSKEEINQSFINLLKKINYPLSNFSLSGYNSEYKYIAKLMDEPLRNLHVVHDFGNDYNYDSISKYFNSIVKNSKYIEIDNVNGVELGNGHIYVCCYPKKKLALWFDDQHDIQYWIFSKPFYCSKVNESVRDMMTPKSTKDVLNEHYPRLADIYSKSKENGLNITVQICNNSAQKKRMPYLAIEFKFFSVFVYDYLDDKPLYADFYIRINRINTGYDIPNFSGDLDGFYDLKKKINRLLSIPILKESVRDMMTPKPKDEMKKIIERLPERERLAKGIEMDVYSKEDIDEMLHGMSPREYFINSFIIEKRIPFSDRKLLPKAKQLIKLYKKVRIGDLLTATTSSINYGLNKEEYPPLMKIIKKITFKSREEFYRYIKEYQQTTHADVFADNIIKDIYKAYSWKKINTVMVERKHWSKYNHYEKQKTSHIIYDYGITTGVFPYTKKELEEFDNN